MKTRFRPLKTIFLLAAALGISATGSSAASTICNNESLTHEQLVTNGWDGTLASLQFAGTLTGTDAKTITALLSLPADHTFAATPGTADQSLAIPAGAAGAFKLSSNAAIGISGNSDSAIRLAEGAAFYVNNGGAINIRDNTASNGAAVRTDAPSATSVGAILHMENANFTNNSATGFGGSIFSNRSNLIELPAARFTGNSAADGGALYSNGGAIFITNDSILANNTATADGGAIHITGDTSFTLSGNSIASSSLTYNTAQNGGAIYSNGSDPGHTTSATISTTSLTDNRATVNGGAYAGENNAHLKLTDTVFTTNTAGASGGALYFNGVPPTSPSTPNTVIPSLEAYTSTFTRNTAQDGGAIYATNDARLALVDSTFEQNSASTAGGALYIGANSTAVISANSGKSTVFTGNLAGGTANSIHLATETGATANLTLYTAATGQLDMRDPLSGSAGAAGMTGIITITKEGTGEWRLGGASVFTAEADGTSHVFLNIKEGRLHLYRSGEARNPPPADSAAYVSTGSIDLGSKGKFYLAPTATLSIGGGNSITAADLEIAGNSSLTLDLEGRTTPDSTAPHLTLAGGTERFIFNPTTLTLENFSLLESGDHTLVDASGIAIAGTFAKPSLTIGGEITSGVRSADGTARILELEADAAVKKLILHVTNSGADSTPATLEWTGRSSLIWQHASPDNNWKGKTESGLLALTYRDGDSVIFGDVSDSTVNISIVPEGISPGNVTINNNQNPYTFTGGDITSSGALTLNGPKGLTLQGLSATFAEGATLRGGWLVLAESEFHTTGTVNLEAGLSLGTTDGTGNPARMDAGSLTIASSGYLIGTGEIHIAGSFVNKGIIAPGFNEESGVKTGTLAIAGALVNKGQIQIKIKSDGTHDTLLNTGTSTLSIGGTVKLFVEPEWLLNNDTTPGFLENASEAGSIRLAPGTRVLFANTMFGYTEVYLRGTVVNAATGEMRATPYAKIAGARNGQDAFAGELARLQYAPDAVANLALSVYDVSEQHTPVKATIARNINAASPIGFGAIPALLVRSANDSNATLRAHLESRREQHRTKPAAPAASSAAPATESEENGEETTAPKASAPTGMDFYFSGGGNILTNGSGASCPFFDYNSGFVSAGADALIGDSLIAGASIAGHFGKARFHQGAGTIHQSQYRATAYLSAAPTSRLVLDANVSGGISRFESTRNVLGLNNTAVTDACDIGAALYASTSFNFFGDALALTPFVGVEYLYLFADSFTERGDYNGFASLRVNSIEQESLQARAGVNLAWRVAPAGVPTRLILGASYGRELADTEANLRTAFANSGYSRKVNVQSTYTSKDTLQIGPSMEISSEHSSLSLGYRYETGFEDRTSHHIRAEFRVKF